MIIKGVLFLTFIVLPILLFVAFGTDLMNAVALGFGEWSTVVKGWLEAINASKTWPYIILGSLFSFGIIADVFGG